MCQKAPSAKRCIKTNAISIPITAPIVGQKAPSAKRCIKTRGPHESGAHACRVRKHRVPNCALRHAKCVFFTHKTRSVRKHRAPNGALRHLAVGFLIDLLEPRQKAPSAKRCIKTISSVAFRVSGGHVRKHRAPNGALRHLSRSNLLRPLIRVVRKHRAPNGALRLVSRRLHDKHVVQVASESTERQTVH